MCNESMRWLGQEIDVEAIEQQIVPVFKATLQAIGRLGLAGWKEKT